MPKKGPFELLSRQAWVTGAPFFTALSVFNLSVINGSKRHSVRSRIYAWSHFLLFHDLLYLWCGSHISVMMSMVHVVLEILLVLSRLR